MAVDPPATVEASNPSRKRSSQRRKETRDRAALGIAAVLLVAALIVFAQSRADGGPPPVSAPAGQPQAQVSTEPLDSGGRLDPGARKAAVRFLETAVGRTSLDEAWALATPELRGGVPLKQWRTGELPVVPFPVQDLETTGFQVVRSSPNKVLLQVLLVPRPGTPYVPTRYDMTLERGSASAPWKVSYCTPYAPPGQYVNPE